MFSCEILSTSYKEKIKMTKEDLLESMEIIIKGNDTKLASELIWKLWMDHGNYQVSNGKVLYKPTGKPISL
jgi:hypothetical protein